MGRDPGGGEPGRGEAAQGRRAAVPALLPGRSWPLGERVERSSGARGEAEPVWRAAQGRQAPQVLEVSGLQPRRGRGGSMDTGGEGEKRDLRNWGWFGVREGRL